MLISTSSEHVIYFFKQYTVQSTYNHFVKSTIFVVCVVCGVNFTFFDLFTAANKHLRNNNSIINNMYFLVKYLQAYKQIDITYYVICTKKIIRGNECNAIYIDQHYFYVYLMSEYYIIFSP